MFTVRVRARPLADRLIALPTPQMAYAVVNPHPHVPMAGDGAATDAVATGFPVTGVPGG